MRRKTDTTFNQIKDLLPKFLLDIERNHSSEIFAKWPQIIGENFAKWTHPISFQKGILRVRVTSSVLYSLLVQQEKQRLLAQLKQQFPKAQIKNINFQIG